MCTGTLKGGGFKRETNRVVMGENSVKKTQGEVDKRHKHSACSQIHFLPLLQHTKAMKRKIKKENDLIIVGDLAITRKVSEVLQNI